MINKVFISLIILLISLGAKKQKVATLVVSTQTCQACDFLFSQNIVKITNLIRDKGYTFKGVTTDERQVVLDQLKLTYGFKPEEPFEGNSQAFYAIVKKQKFSIKNKIPSFYILPLKSGVDSIIILDQQLY